MPQSPRPRSTRRSRASARASRSRTIAKTVHTSRGEPARRKSSSRARCPCRPRRARMSRRRSTPAGDQQRARRACSAASPASAAITSHRRPPSVRARRGRTTPPADGRAAPRGRTSRYVTTAHDSESITVPSTIAFRARRAPEHEHGCRSRERERDDEGGEVRLAGQAPARQQQQHPQGVVEHLHAFADVPAEPVAGGGVLDGAKREVRQLAEPGSADEDDEAEDAAEGDEEPATRHRAEYSLRVGPSDRADGAGRRRRRSATDGQRRATGDGRAARVSRKLPTGTSLGGHGCTIPPPMNTLLRLLLALIGVSMSSSASAADPPATTMAAAAQKFLGTLDPAQKAKAQLPFDSEERFNWFYIPKDARGPAAQADDAAAARRDDGAAARGAEREGLHEGGGHSRARAGAGGDREEPGAARPRAVRTCRIFGEPSPTGTWGWRYEGHHISQNWTVVRGQSIASSPQFFGSNPAEVRSGPKKGTRVLAAEEDLARALLQSLTDAQRARRSSAPRRPTTC